MISIQKASKTEVVIIESIWDQKIEDIRSNHLLFELPLHRLCLGLRYPLLQRSFGLSNTCQTTGTCCCVDPGSGGDLRMYDGVLEQVAFSYFTLPLTALDLFNESSN